MKKQLLAALLISFLGINPFFAQSSSLAQDGVAVFYPKGFDSIKTLPSLAIIKNLAKKDSLPETWLLKPQFLKIEGKNSVKIKYDATTDLYGNGEVTGNLRRNNTDVTLWNTDNYEFTKFDGKQLYQSHPWILGVRKDGTAFGILADNTWKQEFKLNNPIEIISEGPSFRMIIIEKESPQEVLKTLGELTGTIELPPIWAIGYQQSRYSYFPADTARKVATEFRERNIPADVIWMDIDYMKGFRVFTFDEQGIQPEKLNKDLHDKDFKVVYMIDPGVKKDSSYFVYKQGTANNLWVLNSDGKEFNGKVWPGICAFPDYTMPATQKWWAGLYKDFMSTGIDGVWNDMNEPSVFDSDNLTMPENNIHRGGGELPKDIHMRYHNIYGMLMVRSSREGIMAANPDKRPFVLSRANFLGGQRYAATWTGDNHSSWEYLKMSIPMTLNLSLSGQPFNGPDVGGFTGDATPNIFGNWIAIGTYFPFSRNHSSSNTRAQEPWAFGKEIEDVSRTAIDRRYRLMPYLYTLFREASVTGMPIMRPVFFADIKDENLREEQQSFLLGENLLIIPQWAENVKIPKGNWEKIPFEKEDDGYQATVKLKPGAIVPLGPVIQSTEEYNTQAITLLVNPDKKGNAFGKLYDDAGNGYEYKSGDFSVENFKVTTEEKQLKLEVSHANGNRKTERKYRIGLVKNDTILYSGWSSEKIQFLPIKN